jgi:hypothetical protein
MVILLFLIMVVNTLFPIINNNKALVVVPVADLLLEPYGQTMDEESVINSYKRLACGDQCCDRAYQLLFQEIVTLEEQVGIEVKIRVPHIIYYDSKRKCYDNTYWTLASNLVPLKKLEKKIELSLLPKPICWSRQDLSSCNSGIVTLIMPFNDPVTKKIYSAGTRFVTVSELGEYFKVWIFDVETRSVKSSLISKQISKTFENKVLRERIDDYVALLKKWTALGEGFIPYVFSGSSFTNLTNIDEFESRQDEQGCAFYWRDEYGKQPYAGFDCSCIISRVAQICGMAYFYKDSQTLVRNLEPIGTDDAIKNGDIIWFPGHVMIVSDVENNKLIESRGYAAGFGKTHEVALSKAFAEISNYAQLKKAHLYKHNLKLLARDGSLRYVLEDFKILKFESYTKFCLKAK